MIDLKLLFGEPELDQCKLLLSVADRQVDDGDLPGDDLPFADWLLWPDASGRIGVEHPGLTEQARWWARCDFGDLPNWPAWCGL